MYLKPYDLFSFIHIILTKAGFARWPVCPLTRIQMATDSLPISTGLTGTTG